MSDEIKHLAGRLDADGQKTIDYFESLPPADWTIQVYTTGSAWTVRDILAHFVSAERSFRLLVADVAAGGDGAPKDLNIVEFNEREVPKLAEMAPQELLAAFGQARRLAVEQARQLRHQDLDRTGFHPWFGEVELRDMLKLIYRHNMIHLRDVRKAIGQRGPLPHQDIDPPSAQNERA